MLRTTEVVAIACLLAVLAQCKETQASPSWRPQGRFGKRMETGTRLLDSANSWMVDGEIEMPMEELVKGEAPTILRVVAKLCSLTGVDGLPPCRWATPSSEDR